MTVRRLLIAFAGWAVIAAAQGQTLAGLKVEPASAKVGEPVKVTLEFSDAASPNCSVRLHFGDGTKRDFKINQAKDVPLIATHNYAKAGTYALKAEGKTALPMLKCVGANQLAAVTVAPVATAGAARAKPSCPEGWTLDAKRVDRRSGAFTCTAKAGTSLPAARLVCPSPLGYYENAARGQLGCRP
ncbi:MAG TPA: hypothetical protein VFQ20_00250 [Burkholderiaceae bacterium]|nr:hypothetical protein [Burkholderiaceae bacterium]